MSVRKEIDLKTLSEAYNTQMQFEEQTLNQKNDAFNAYAVALQAHKATRTPLIHHRAHHRGLTLTLAEKMKIINSIDAAISNRHAQESIRLQDAIEKMYDNRDQDSLKYDQLTQCLVGEMDNLSSLFEHELLDEQIINDRKESHDLESIVKIDESNYQECRRAVVTTPERYKSGSLDAILGGVQLTSDVCKRKISKSENILILVEKNIEFLTEENSKILADLNH